MKKNGKETVSDRDLLQKMELKRMKQTQLMLITFQSILFIIALVYGYNFIMNQLHTQSKEEALVMEQDNRFLEVKINEQLFVFADKETGVQYLRAEDGGRWSVRTKTIPLLNSDGTPFTDVNIERKRFKVTETEGKDPYHVVTDRKTGVEYLIVGDNITGTLDILYLLSKTGELNTSKQIEVNKP